ncbi:MAG: S-layer homology domain-containing protein, partial [Oscillospiraceae bacterium]|nr:S-layer homology domain-containing protein [Oscillospiraceae bacterium]
SQSTIETAPVKPDDTGKAAVTVETAKVTEAVAEAVKAVEAAKADGKTNAAAEVVIPIKTEGDAAVKAVEAAIPAEAIKVIAEAKDVILTVESEVSTITLDAATLTAIADAAGSGETVTLTAAVVDNSEALNAKQQAAVGDNPVIELNISVGDTAITDFSGTVTVSVPYTPKTETAAEDYDLLTVYYLDDNGNIAEMTGASYDAETGQITFSTTHFSKFFISEWISPFGDIAKGEWYYKAARYAYSNGLITGVTETTFAPQTSLTRAMLITILARDAGIDTAGGATWYSKAIEWGIANGITDGTNPNGEITREQFATMLYRYAVQELRIENGELRIANGDVSGYSDAGQISEWAYDAMAWANATGLITGRTETTLAPQGTATRAEAATILQRFIENLI